MLRLPAPWFAVLPLLLLALWHFAVDLRWVAEGIIPSPEQVVRSWYTWIFGSTTAMLSPYSGTWLDNVDVFDAPRAARFRPCRNGGDSTWADDRLEPARGAPD